MAVCNGRILHSWCVAFLCISSQMACAMDGVVACGTGTLHAMPDDKAQLFVAVAKGDIVGLDRLIDAGVEWRELVSANGSTLLHRALAYGHVDIGLRLVERGADVCAANAQGWTPLHVVICNRNEEGMVRVARALLAAGADPNATTKIGLTPIGLAVENRNVEFVRLLLNEWRVDVTAAHHALEQVCAKDMAIAALVKTKYQAEVEQGDRVQVRKAAFLVAAGRGGVAALQRLHSDGVDITVEDECGNSALQLAVNSWHNDAALFLIEAGADVRAADASGRTLLHAAVDHDMLEVVIELLTGGADPCLVDSYGKSPFNYAVESGNTELITHLVLAGADPMAALPYAEWKYGAESKIFKTLRVLAQELKQEYEEDEEFYRQRLNAPDWDCFPAWLARVSPCASGRALPMSLDFAPRFTWCENGDGSSKRQCLV